MIKSPTPVSYNEYTVSPGTRTIVEVHKNITPDQLIDSLARGGAMEVKYGHSTTVAVAKEIRSKLVRVTYG